MNSARIVLNPRQDLTAEQARDARARAWVYVFQCWREKQNAAGMTSTNGNDPERRSDEIRAKTRIP
jgi:hypothetical protein